MLDRAVNLVDERIDLAIRISNDLDPNLIARRLTVCRSVICASPRLSAKHPAPRRVEELSLHNCLTHSYFGKSLWHFEQHGEPVSVAVSGNISANEASTPHAGNARRRRRGDAAHVPGRVHIRSGDSMRLLPTAEPRQMSIHAVYASRKHMPAALRSLLDFLVEVPSRAAVGSRPAINERHARVIGMQIIARNRNDREPVDRPAHMPPSQCRGVVTPCTTRCRRSASLRRKWARPWSSCRSRCA